MPSPFEHRSWGTQHFAQTRDLDPTVAMLTRSGPWGPSSGSQYPTSGCPPQWVMTCRLPGVQPPPPRARPFVSRPCRSLLSTQAGGRTPATYPAHSGATNRGEMVDPEWGGLGCPVPDASPCRSSASGRAMFAMLLCFGTGHCLSDRVTVHAIACKSRRLAALAITTGTHRCGRSRHITMSLGPRRCSD